MAEKKWQKRGGGDTGRFQGKRRTSSAGGSKGSIGGMSRMMITKARLKESGRGVKGVRINLAKRGLSNSIPKPALTKQEVQRGREELEKSRTGGFQSLIQNDQRDSAPA